MNLGKVEIWETSLDRIVTLREGAKGVLRPECDLPTDPRWSYPAELVKCDWRI